MSMGGFCQLRPHCRANYHLACVQALTYDVTDLIVVACVI